MVENDARGLAGVVVPISLARGDQIGLAFQHHAIIEHAQAVGGQRRAGGGDVDDQLGGADRGRALGGAGAFHNPVVDDAVRGEEVAGQVDVFGRDPHPPVVLGTEAGGDVVEIGHGAHIDPGLRHRHHHVGAAKAEAFDQGDALVGIDDALADQVFAGDAEMHGATRQIGGDLAGRQIGDLDIVEPGNGAAIVTGAAGLGQVQAGAREEVFGVFLQAALGGNGENERRGHDALPATEVAGPDLVSASIQIAKPTAGIGSGAPSWDISPS